MKILYFPSDFSPENIAFAKSHGLKMRNAAAYYEGDSVELCDAVCGDVPAAYGHLPQHELPQAESKLADGKATVAQLKEQLAALGVEIPENAKKADLEALLAAKLAEKAE